MKAALRLITTHGAYAAPPVRARTLTLDAQTGDAASADAGDGEAFA